MTATLSKSTMQQLATAARRGDRKALGDVLSALGYGGGFAEIAGTPVSNLTPARKGEHCLDTTNGTWWRAKGLANTDWVTLGDPDISLAELTFLDGAVAGTAVASKALVLSATKTLTWTTTSASTSSSVSVEPLSMTNTMTGIGGVGGRAKYRLDTNVKLGGWANALKAHTVFGASGGITGLASAFVGELELSAGTTDGTYTALEAEIVLGSGASTGTASSFLYCNASGAGVAAFDTSGFFFEIGAGITAGDTKLFAAESKSGIAKTHTLKVKIDGTIYYMALHTAQNFGGS